MELNGIANIKMMIETAVRSNVQHHQEISPELADKINEQLELLERYMLAYKDAAEEQQYAEGCGQDPMDYKEPHWHEVRENPEKYPLLRERMDELRNRIKKD